MEVDVLKRPPRVRPLSAAAIALVLGVTIGLGGWDDALPYAVALLVVLALAAAVSRRRGALVGAALLCVLVSGWLLGLGEQRRARGDCRARWASGARVRVTALSLGFLAAEERGSVKLRPETPRDGGCDWVGTLRAWADGPIRPGERYRVEGAWRPANRPHRGAVPPERRGWLVAHDLERLGPASVTFHPFVVVRGILAERLWRVYPQPWSPLALALVLGQRESMDPEVTQRIARAGLAHLLAISGLHVGMLAAAVFLLARIGRLTVRRAYGMTVVITAAYVLLIGAPASAVRAGLMVGLWALSRLAGRASSAFDVLGLAAVILLLARPWSVVEPGFQLSFAGAAAVGYVHREAQRASWPRNLPGLARAGIASLLVSGAAVLLTAPITALHFGRVAPAAVFGNLIAVPLLGLAMPPLFLSAALSAWPALAAWPAAAAVTLLRGIDLVTRILSVAPWSSFDVPPPGLLAGLAYTLMLILGAHAFRGAWFRRRFILGLGVVMSLVLIWPAARGQLGAGRLAIYVLDVGQGDAIAIATPKRHWVVVDAGPKIHGFDAGKSRVVPFLKSHGARRLEAWLASHPDLDHVGGAPAIFANFEVERVIGSGHITGQSGQLAVLRWLGDASIPWLRGRAGSRLVVGEVELVFLHPGGGSAPEKGSLAPNDLSLVFLLVYGDFRMLFTGDVSGAVEDRLSEELGAGINAQVLKVAHHGSTTSTHRQFLSAVDPELAVISVGRGNRYGHPAPQVLWRLAVPGREIRRTDVDGTVIIEARRDGKWTVRTAAEGW